MTDKSRVPWILLWDQVQKHYGDVRKEETTKQFIERMMSKFELTIKLKNNTNEMMAEMLDNEQINSKNDDNPIEKCPFCCQMVPRKHYCIDYL